MGSIPATPDIAQSADSAAMSTPLILDLFAAAKKENRPLYVSAPMVRYSKLPFRLLAQSHGVDVIYTPMMLAHEFNRSPIARDSDFTTHPLERGQRRRHAVIAQFASSDAEEFARAAELIGPWVDGVSLNCGCPQSWAIKEGIGCSLMEDGERVAGLVRAAKGRVGSGGSVGVKIRVHRELGWVETVQRAGVDYITVHGRTRSQRSSTAPDYDAIRQLRAHISVPLIANGDAYSLEDVNRIATLTLADGVMAARGILENPALFMGAPVTPAECVGAFMAWVVRCPIPFPLVLHHITEMTARMEGMTKRDRKVIMECEDMLDLLDFVEERWGLPASTDTG